MSRNPAPSGSARAVVRSIAASVAEGDGGELRVMPIASDFGEVTVGTFKHQAITLTNEFRSAVTITSVRLVAGSAGFNVLAPTATRLQPDGTGTLRTLFYPSSIGKQTATVRIAYTVSGRGTFLDIPLTGTSTPTPVDRNPTR